MRLSDLVSERILALLNEQDGIAEICRNELAEDIGCVPSQINYVISSRFTPEHGYIVESRRGGGGYVRITRVQIGSNSPIMHLVNSIGDTLDFPTAKAILGNLYEQQIISRELFLASLGAFSDKCYRNISNTDRNIIRAEIMKQILLTII